MNFSKKSTNISRKRTADSRARPAISRDIKLSQEQSKAKQKAIAKEHEIMLNKQETYKIVEHCTKTVTVPPKEKHSQPSDNKSPADLKPDQGLKGEKARIESTLWPELPINLGDSKHHIEY